MVNDQEIAGYAGRDTLPVDVLAKILFKDTIRELEQRRVACSFYPATSTKGEKKLIKDYINFSNWVVALVHPYPQYHPSIVDIVNTSVKSKDFYDWLSENTISLSPKARLFKNIFEEKKALENGFNINKNSEGKKFNVRREARKLETQKQYKNWQKEYKYFKNQNPRMSDRECANRIARMNIGNGKSPTTIRKQMKP